MWGLCVFFLTPEEKNHLQKKPQKSHHQQQKSQNIADVQADSNAGIRWRKEIGNDNLH